MHVPRESPEPVFVDRTGRRRCLFAVAGTGGADVTHVGAEGSGPAPQTDHGEPAPAAVTGGGPVQRIGAGGDVTTRAMPAKTIALTFDDGPDPRWTPRILDVLARYGAHATFFEIGSGRFG